MLSYPLVYKPRPSFGLDVGQHTAKFLELKRSGKGYKVVGMGQCEIADGYIVEGVIAEPESLAENLRVALEKPTLGSVRAPAVTAGIPQAHVFTRTINLPAMQGEKLTEAVQWESQQYIPMPMSDLYMDYEIINAIQNIDGKPASLEVLMVAAPRAIIDSYIKLCELLRLIPNNVETSLVANHRALHPPHEKQTATLLIDAGATTIDIGIVNAHVIVSTTLTIGGDHLRAKIAQGLSVSDEHAEELLIKFGIAQSGLQDKIFASLKPELEKIMSEIKKLMKYYNERATTKHKAPIENITLSGQASHMPGFAAIIHDFTKLPVTLSSAWDHYAVDQTTPLPVEDMSAYTTAFGLALRDLKESKR